MGPTGERRSARAFAPGHLTGFFVPDLSAHDPRARGSLGAGLVLDRGVVATVSWDPEGPDGIRMRSTPVAPLPVSRSVARRLKGARRGSLRVALEHALPIGQGLGMSAAGAVATGLAVARVLDRPPALAWQSAHLAELEHRGGLGGVAALSGGGLEVRTRAGVPPWGEVRHRPYRAPLTLLTFGAGIPSPKVLGSARWVRRIHSAGRRSLAGFTARPDWGTYWDEAERFTDSVGLLPDRLRPRISTARAQGWALVQAMFGRVLVLAPRTSGKAAAPRPAALAHLRSISVEVGDRGAGLVRSRIRPTG
jgi:pantoate kinase